MKTLKKIIFWFLIIMVLIQFIPVDRTQKPVDRKINFTDVLKTPPKITQILQKSCYDCHSNETIYPKYAYFAPISWSVSSHVSDGREHLNFSEWGKYNSDLKKSMLKNAVTSIREKEMPMPGYIAFHREANITTSERKMLTDYFQQLMEKK